MNGAELGWRRECDDADALLRHLGLSPEQCRTDGGWLNVPRIKTLLAELQPKPPEGHSAAASNRSPGGAASWRCFHCGELFTDRQEAQDHFGESEHDRPFCQMDANYIRWLLAQHRRNVDDDSEALRTVRSLASQHEELRRRAEELGYARGLADAKRHPEELGLVADRSAATSPDEDVLPVAWLNPLWPKYCGPHSPVSTYEVTGWRPLIPADQLRTAIAAERERNTAAHLACGHPAELMLRSAETGAPLYCELCDDKAGRRDAEKRESELQAELSTLRQQLAEAGRERDALRAQVDAAVPAMRDYARRNPRWKSRDNGEVEGKMQDPNGVNAWLEQIDAAIEARGDAK